MASKDFICYRNIFAIDPGYSFKNGAGYAIFDDETFKLKACGLVRPFAPGLESPVALDEIKNKICLAWENHVGFSYDPKHIIIEFPRIYPLNRINQTSLLNIACLGGMIRASYKTPTEKVHYPQPSDWKGNSQKVITKELIYEVLDAWSIKRLENDLAKVPASLHHNIFDAVGLGVWLFKKIRQE